MSKQKPQKNPLDRGDWKFLGAAEIGEYKCRVSRIFVRIELFLIPQPYSAMNPETQAIEDALLCTHTYTKPWWRLIAPQFQFFSETPEDETNKTTVIRYIDFYLSCAREKKVDHVSDLWYVQQKMLIDSIASGLDSVTNEELEKEFDALVQLSKSTAKADHKEAEGDVVWVRVARAIGDYWEKRDAERQLSEAIETTAEKLTKLCTYDTSFWKFWNLDTKSYVIDFTEAQARQRVTRFILEYGQAESVSHENLLISGMMRADSRFVAEPRDCPYTRAIFRKYCDFLTKLRSPRAVTDKDQTRRWVDLGSEPI